MKHVALFVSSILLCELVGVLATPFTLASIPTWYAHLHKPFFSPPNWIFGPVWTLLYLCMGISIALILHRKWNKKIKIAVFFFAAQLFANFLWSLLFFGLHSPILGLLDIVLLAMLIFITMQHFSKISRPATLLLLPYFLWVCFATFLNAAILFLN